MKTPTPTSDPPAHRTLRITFAVANEMASSVRPFQGTKTLGPQSGAYARKAAADLRSR
jgi:hypothetical protein